MAKDTFLNRKITLKGKGPEVMAILNLTPDSFYSDSRIANIDAALQRTADFLTAGAKFIDLGAYSSRPGATHISEEEEMTRLIPVVVAIAKEFPQALLSIDTFRSKVAEAAINCGAHLINDISGGSLDELMFKTVAKLNVPYVMMHMKGNPQTMQQNPIYENITSEVINYFTDKIKIANEYGIKDVIIDPGFGFAKTTDHNYELLREMEVLNCFELPILVGFSRKSMITKVLHNRADDALNGTSVLNTIALTKGASILRVHDVKEAVECVTLFKQLTQ